MTGEEAPATFDPALSQPVFRRGFVDGRFGQMHLWRTRPPDKVRSPLVVLSPSPYSGAYYQDLARALVGRREVIAVDTPGYGASSPPSAPPALEDYAAAFGDALGALGLAQTPVDLLGFHSGAMFAVELALQREAMVRKLVLGGLPFYAPETRAEALEPATRPVDIREDGAHLLTYWGWIVGGRQPETSLLDAQQRFNDFVPSLPNSGWTYHGLARYPAEQRIPQVRTDVLILLINEALLSKTRDSLPLFQNARTADLTHLGRDAFHLGAGEIADVVDDFLGESPAP
jgi:pimeloyl-ACP methyl ester carboxylesterase